MSQFTKYKTVYFIQSLWDGHVMEDNIEKADIQEALDRAVAAQRLAGLYRDRVTFTLCNKTVDANVVEAEIKEISYEIID